ncbi:hypothetical protein DEM27_32565 [Metarhizobium album]|uniref:Uncharacterized protein n=1 Tax=Metarhizobium album TaxID=2182425 RepID=A0A2U2DFN7_9HYPH|nr:hypothetical protein [Rhizobium album]PWE52135.1 hypothetical protein DEM27_32565 [Rhizobium album]
MTDAPLPLLNWQRLVEIDRLAKRREELCQRIAKLKPHAHQRVALEERIRQVTLQQMQLENQLQGRRQ